MDNKTRPNNYNQNGYRHQRQQYHHNNQRRNYAQNPSYTNNRQQVQTQINNPNTINQANGQVLYNRTNQPTQQFYGQPQQPVVTPVQNPSVVQQQVFQPQMTQQVVPNQVVQTPQPQPVNMQPVVSKPVNMQQVTPQPQLSNMQQAAPAGPVEQQPTIEQPVTHNTQVPQQPSLPKYEFNSEEKVIYQMKEEKAASPLISFIIVGLIIGIVFLLPVITNKLGTIKLLNFTTAKSNNQTTTSEEEEKNEKFQFYDIVATAKIGSLGINQLGLGKNGEEYEMTFSIYNYSNEPYTFNKKYYINLYNDKNALLYTALLYSFEPLAANSSREMSLIVPGKIYGEASKFDVEEFDVNRYKPYKLESNDGEYQVLTCHYNFEEIKYYFRDNLLEKIYETHTESISSSNNYSSNKIKYENLSSYYRTIGLDSHFEDKSTLGTFTMVTEINYKTNPISDYNLNNLKQYKYFKYNTSSDIIAHEMPTIAYTCS